MFIARFSLGLAFALLVLPRDSSAAESRKPNIIFFMADDLGYGDVGCFGQKLIRTPNIDRLAKEGMKFTQHYAGNPVCAPSRCVLMTGKHSGHSYVRDNRETKPEGQFPIPASTVTLAKLFKQGGYTTGAFGKWGLGGPESDGAPLRQGFDRFYGYNCQRVAHNLYPTYLWDNDKRVALSNVDCEATPKLAADADPKNPASYALYIGKEYAPDLYAEQALRFIRDNKERPFFLYFPTIVPHLALQVPEDSLKEYDGKFPETPYTGGRGYLPQRAPRAAYAAMVTRMDREVGRMLALIKELNLDENTIFVFTSDNGPAPQDLAGIDSQFFNSNGPLRDGKGSVYEGGIRVPLIVRWKGKIKEGTTSEQVTGFEDWMPTLMDLTQQKTKLRDIDGISFAPVLLGKELSARPFLYREFPASGGQQSIRVGDWKAVRRNLKPKDKTAPDLSVELYDLAKDIEETTNVAGQHPDVVARLAKLMAEQHVPSKEFPFPALDKLRAN